MSITNENILEEIRKNRHELKSLIEAVEMRITLKLEDLNRRLNKLERENDTITNNIERLERKSKENNILIFGLQTKPEEITVDFIRQELKNLVDVNIVESDLNNFYPLGKSNNPPIKIEFTSYLKKATVFKNAKNLKGTNIAIANDLTIKQRKQKQILKKHLNLARENKEENCFIKGYKLHVNGKIYTPEELENSEETEDITLKKPNSVPSTPTTATAREIIKPSVKPVEPASRNPQQKFNTTILQSSGKSLKETGERMKTRTNSGK